MDPHNDHTFASNDALKYWKEVDLYVGGSEHATGHLLYSRFWQMFLYDFKLVSTEVYAKKLVNQGMILGNSALIYREIDSGIFISSDSLDDEKIQKINVDINFINQNNELDLKQFIDWQPEYSEAKFKMKNEAFKVEREVQKMSKSKYNVVNPDDICDSYGADTLRLYEMFLGPIEQAKPWNTNGISGVFNFLNKVWKLFYDENNLIVVDSEPDNESLKILNQTIKKINHDIENFSFNTCVSSLMILVNKLTDKKCSSSKVLKPLSILLSPFAPHLAEELWFILGNQNSIIDEVFPEHDPNLLIEKEKNYPVSFNGKLKFQILLSNDLSKQEVEEIISNHDLTIKNLDGKSIKKIIFVPNKIINVVC
jgi:leucyl-tRNA synthetase